jgi:hypothetical protein
MPRDGSFIYTIPPGTEGVPDTTIESAKYNTFIHDVETDLNAPRPIIAGGTGGNSPAQARDNLDAEVSMQVLTNFDSDPLEVGSFYAAATATNPPVAGHAFTGIIYGPDANNLVISGRDLNDTITPGRVWTRQKIAGVWSAWSNESVFDKVAKAGDTMTGNLKISKLNPQLTLDDTAAGSQALVVTRAGVARWQENYGLNAETGANVGSDYAIGRYTDAGALIDLPLQITRSTGLAKILANPTDPLGIVPKQYVDGVAVRYDTAQALTDPQQLQARSNVYAAPFDAEAFNGIQVNAAMDISQWGITSYGLVQGSLQYIVDCWQAHVNNTVTAITVTPSAVGGVVGQTLHLQMQCALGGPWTGAGDYCRFYTAIEGHRVRRLGWGAAGAIPITICFMMYGPTPGKVAVAVNSSDALHSYVGTVTLNAANTWEFKSITIPPDTSGNWLNDNRLGMGISICSLCGSNFQATAGVWNTSGSQRLCTSDTANQQAAAGQNWGITGVAIFPGSQGPTNATQLAQCMRPRWMELELCKRYWQLILLGWVGVSVTGNNHGANFQFGVECRVVPTMGLSSNVQNVGFPTSSATFQQTGTYATNAYKTASGSVSGIWTDNYIVDARL